MRQLLRRSRPKLRERIAEGQTGDELEELVRGGLVFLIFDSRDFRWPFHSGSTNAQDLSKGQPGTRRDIAPKERCKRKLVRSKGLEPLRAFTHQLLRLARLLIPPRPQAAILTAALGTSEMFMNSVQRSQVRAAPRLPVVGPKKRPAEYVGPAVNDFPRLFQT